MPKTPQRTERICIRLQLDKKYVSELESLIKAFVDHDPQMCEGDILNLTYELFINYWGDVATKLRLLNKIMTHPGIKIIQANLKELTDGTCLIQEICTNIHTLQKAIKPKPPSLFRKFMRLRLIDLFPKKIQRKLNEYHSSNT